MFWILLFWVKFEFLFENLVSREIEITRIRYPTKNFFFDRLNLKLTNLAAFLFKGTCLLNDTPRYVFLSLFLYIVMLSNFYRIFVLIFFIINQDADMGKFRLVTLIIII